LSRKRSFTHRPLIRGDAPFLECARSTRHIRHAKIPGTTQRTKIMKAIIALTALLTAATVAEAQYNQTIVTVGGQDWEISTVRGTYEQNKELLTKQPWFGHKSLARDFMMATYGLKFDGLRRNGPYYFPNTGGNVSWHFAYLDTVMPDGRIVPAGKAGMVSDNDGCNIGGPLSEGYQCSYWPHLGAGTPDGYDTACIRYDDSPYDRCYWAVATLVNQPFGILPVSGSYPGTDKMDFVVTGVAAKVDHINVIYNGRNVDYYFDPCWKRSGETLRCDGVDWSAYGYGQHTIEVYLDLSNGTQHYEAVQWTVY
jgi:hypothetical protein